VRKRLCAKRRNAVALQLRFQSHTSTTQAFRPFVAAGADPAGSFVLYPPSIEVVNARPKLPLRLGGFP